MTRSLVPGIGPGALDHRSGHDLAMTDLLALSARYIDEGGADGPNSTNPMSGELRELADGIAMVEAFSHVVAFRTDEGLAVFDTSSELFASHVETALGQWTTDPVDTIVYTH